MIPVPTEFSYPTHYFSYEIFIGEEEKWHPPMLGRDTLFYEYAGAFGRFIAFNIQYWLASRTNPIQSFFVRFFFEKIFFFQDYIFPFIWLYFPWITVFFNYPIGIFHLQFEFYFPYFFFFCSFISVIFYIFSVIFYDNRTSSDFFFGFFILSYFFIAFPIFFYFSIPNFIFGIIIFFFLNTFSFPISLYFSEYVKFSIANFFSVKSFQLYLPAPTKFSSKSTSFSFVEQHHVVPQKKTLKHSNFFRSNNLSSTIVVKTFKRFTKYPFFNSNLNSLRSSIIKRFYNNNFYSYSSIRFKKGINDIRQFTPNEGPAIYDLKIPDYDSDRFNLFSVYEELDDLLETEIELEFGPDFENANDPFIPPENDDEWEQLSSQHFHTYKYKHSRISYFTNSSSDLDFDFRPAVSNWIQNEIGRTWALKHWLRILNPKHTNTPISFVLLERSTFYHKSQNSTFFKYLLYGSSYYFKILDSFFNFFFPPFILRRFSSEITINDFNLFIIEISKFELAFFFTFSNYTNLLRVLFSLETFFINNNKFISFETKLFYFSTLLNLFHFFNTIYKKKYNVDFDNAFILKVVISQIFRILGKKKKNF